MATTNSSAFRKAVLQSRATFVLVAMAMAPTACSAAADIARPTRTRPTRANSRGSLTA
jgi:hypothetical protein